MRFNSIDELLLEVSLSDVGISDFSSYFGGMKKGISDKLFFLNHIKPDLIVDFGSADGSIIEAIHELHPQIRLIGYDISPEMIRISREKKLKNVGFTSKWSAIRNVVKKFKSPCLLLSSVIHEVYSYSSKEAVDKFWGDIFEAGFEYIVIRDTIPPIDIENVKDFDRDVDKVRKIVDPNLLRDYENRWGPIDSNYKNFVRFVLMYRYRSNWARERLEDYLPLSYESLLLKIKNTNYRVIYNKSYRFKPIQSSLSKDYGINLRKPIHLKMMLRKV